MWENVNVMYGSLKTLETIITEVTFTEFWIFLLDFLSWTVTIHRGAEEGEGYPFNFLQPLPLLHRHLDISL